MSDEPFFYPGIGWVTKKYLEKMSEEQDKKRCEKMRRIQPDLDELSELLDNLFESSIMSDISKEKYKDRIDVIINILIYNIK